MKLKEIPSFMRFLSKLGLCTLPWITLGLIPEFTMWGVWNLISPETEVGRIIMIAIFLFGGGAWCVFFAFLAFAGFVATIEKFM